MTTQTTTTNAGLCKDAEAELQSQIAGLRNLKIHYQEVFDETKSPQAFKNIQNVTKAILCLLLTKDE